jgi:alkylation response protein AidB-like acyl-CoA dehydrogenase
VDFELDDDQHALQEAVRDLVDRECSAELVRAVVEGRDDGSDFWKTLVSLHWQGLTIPEEDGGTGMTAVELVLALEELGRGADPTPFLATTSQYVPLVRWAMGDEPQHTLLTAVASGTTGTAAFLDETDPVRASRRGGGWALAGTARHVIDGDRADELAVVALTEEGHGVFVVPLAGLTVTVEPTFDGGFHLVTVALDGVEVPDERTTVGPTVVVGVGKAHDEALAGLSAMMVGASQRVLEMVLEHVKERHQFGVPIGSFQAVKHMAVDMFVVIQRARALVQFAALTIAEDDERRPVAASMAKASAGDCQRLVVKHGIQLYGGLGFTWENDLQIYVRRAKVGEPLLGDTSEHRARVARATLATLDPAILDAEPVPSGRERETAR